MPTRGLKRLMAEAAKLTPARTLVLIQALGTTDAAAQVVQAVQARVPACARCHGERIVRNGHAGGQQRYKCRGCTRTFNALTDTPLARLRHKDKWERQAEVLRQSLRVHQAADVLAVALSTAFRWRHRFLQLPQDLKAGQLHGVVEADETYFLRSCKGQRVNGRKARHRGGGAAKRGLSNRQEPVLVARDLRRHGRLHPGALGQVSYHQAQASVLAVDAVPCTETHWVPRPANWGSSTMP